METQNSYRTADRHPLRYAALLISICAGLAAMWAGLARIGWQLPLASAELILAHGPLMVSGFLGTLIGLERAVARGRPWTYAAPALSAAATVILLLVGINSVSAILYALSGLILVLMFGQVFLEHRQLYVSILLVGSGLWMVGNLLWATHQPIFRAVLWWAGFLVLTIAAERLELTRLLRLSRSAQTELAGWVLCCVIGLLLGLGLPDVGPRLLGLGLGGLALWLLRYDVARRTIRESGLTRYIATCLIAGYVWLAVGGLLAVIFGKVIAGMQYDAVLHSLSVGCVISMIFGHGPLIVPAIIQRPFVYRPALYAALALLHVSVITRIAGDLLAQASLRQAGGMLNATAVLLFAACMIYGLLSGQDKPASSSIG